MLAVIRPCSSLVFDLEEFSDPAFASQMVPALTLRRESISSEGCLIQYLELGEINSFMFFDCRMHRRLYQTG